MIYNDISEVRKDLMASEYLRNIGTLRFCYSSPEYDLFIEAGELNKISIVIFYHCSSNNNNITFSLESLEENINTFVDKIIRRLERYHDLIILPKTLSKDEFICYACGILFDKLPRVDLVVEKAFNLGRLDRFAFNLIDYREL